MNKILFSFVLVIISFQSFSNEVKKNKEKKDIEHNVPHTDEKIKVDGVLEEAFWKDALLVDLPYEVNPGENIKAPVETHVLLAYSETHFYLAFKAYDPDPGKIRARYRDRDDIWTDDVVGVIFDTYNDERRAFGFYCNALGMQQDAIEGDQNFDPSWDAIWDSKGQINSEGYIVEISIPFSSLRFQRTNGKQTWGFDAIRSYPRDKRHHIGAFKRDRNVNCYLCQALKITGFEGANPGKNIEIVPTATLQLRKEKNDETGEFDWVSKKPDFGLTGKWGITPNLTLGGIINPDFSQVEADALQMDINEPFALYFEEKRPFFTEGADFFDTQMNAVYTRSIREPVWGTKISGKEGPNTIGAYIVQDELTNLIFPGSQGSDEVSIAQKSYSGVFRYKRDIGEKYTVGALITDRESKEYYNHFYSVDANLRLTEKDQIFFQAGGSSTMYPDSVALENNQQKGSFSDYAFDFYYNHTSRNLEWFASYENYGADFRADQGFIPMVNFIEYGAGSSYIWTNDEKESWWSEFSVGGEWDYVTEQDKDLLEHEGELFFHFAGIKLSELNTGYNFGKEFYEGKEYLKNQFFFETTMRPVEDLGYGIELFYGDQIDYSNSRLGDVFQVNPSITLDLGLHINAELSYTYEMLKFNKDWVYEANMLGGRLKYQFDKRTMIRGVLQYRKYNRNLPLYTLAELPNNSDEKFFSQFLFSYKINPQTVLFLGYSDNYRGRLNRQDNEDISFFDNKRDWSVFFKVGYAIVPM